MVHAARAVPLGQPMPWDEYDLVVKTRKYAAAGLPHYWIVDPRDRALDAYALDESGLYRHVAHLDLEGAPAPTELSFGVGTVVVDLRELLGDA